MDASINTLTSLLELIYPYVVPWAVTKSEANFKKGAQTDEMRGIFFYENIIILYICRLLLKDQ